MRCLREGRRSAQGHTGTWVEILIVTLALCATLGNLFIFTNVVSLSLTLHMMLNLVAIWADFAFLVMRCVSLGEGRGKEYIGNVGDVKIKDINKNENKTKTR